MENSEKIRVMAASVAGGLSIRDAGAVVGYTEQSSYQVSKTAEFRSMVYELRAEAVDRAVNKISQAAFKAVDTLLAGLDSGDESVKLKSAVAILNKLVPVSDFAELRHRIAALEARSAAVEDDA